VQITKLARSAGHVTIARTMGGGSQNFLGAPWVAGLVRHSPAGVREPLALRLLALSPHYFYDRDVRAEADRNRRSRRALAEALIAPHLTPAARVIDYGCGPGYMARAVAAMAGPVTGVDISPGVLACARVLNPAPNLTYLTLAELARRASHDGASHDGAGQVRADLAYSFAVAQHLSGAALARALGLLAAALVPGGTLLLHFAEPGADGYRREEAWARDRSLTGRVKLRYGLNCFGRPAAEMAAAVTAAGFTEVTTRRLAGDLVVDGDEDITRQHLLTARRESIPENHLITMSI
jgi:SAM-dependent methyltransferase